MHLSEFSNEQEKAICELEKALKKFNKLKLALRVYDGAILVTQIKSFSDPRYGEFGSEGTQWIEDCTFQVGIGVNADGGAGN